MSKSRPRAAARAESAACSRKIAAGPDQAKASGQPRRRPTCASAHQSGRAAPGAGRKARWREMRRSEFVTVPDFSPQPAAGSSTSASRAVSVRPVTSETTTKGQAASAAATASASGMLAAGLVARIQSALILPSAAARNMSTAFRPGRAAMVGERQKSRTAARWAGSSSSRCAASMLARPPTSRPPMAFGWPVTEKGPAPGRPMRPVARWQLRIALTLSVPEVDWFTPWLKTVTVRSVRSQRRRKASRSAGSRPQAAAVRSRSQGRAASSAAGRPSTWAAM